MTNILVFLTLLLLVSGYAAWRGGAPERVVAALLVIATIASALAPWERYTTFRTVHWALLGTDAALFAALMLVAMFADRFWPMWLASLQLIAVAAHGARGYDPNLLALSYWWIVGKISYPMVAILGVGTFRHWRRRKRGAPEFAWTVQRQRSDARSRASNSDD